MSYVGLLEGREKEIDKERRKEKGKENGRIKTRSTMESGVELLQIVVAIERIIIFLSFKSISLIGLVD